MAVYNAEKCLVEAIESVLNQTFKDFELIIINDASTDNSLNILKEYASRDPRIVLLNNEKNLGISGTRNKGIKISKGKYIAIQDSDDVSLKDRFSKQVDFLEKNPSVGVVGSYIQIINEKNEPLSIRKYPSQDEKLRKSIFFCSPVAQPSSMIRSEVFIKVGLYDKRYPPVEDLDLWFRMGSVYKFANIPEILLNYRYYPNSETTTKLKRMEKISNKLRFKNWNNPSFHFGFLEFLYNFLHLISLFIIPSKFKLWLFMRIRDKKIRKLVQD